MNVGWKMPMMLFQNIEKKHWLVELEMVINFILFTIFILILLSKKIYTNVF
jgi:hypothetical protein